jgi:hypothetical protein
VDSSVILGSKKGGELKNSFQIIYYIRLVDESITIFVGSSTQIFRDFRRLLVYHRTGVSSTRTQYKKMASILRAPIYLENDIASECIIQKFKNSPIESGLGCWLSAVRNRSTKSSLLRVERSEGVSAVGSLLCVIDLRSPVYQE